MLRSLNVKNFRLFDDLNISRFDQINLIAGKNNVGKTALLETIFLLLGAGNSSLAFRINLLRGIKSVLLDPNEIWGWLFNNRRIEKPIMISCKDEQKVEHHLKLVLTRSTTEQYRPDQSKIEPITGAVTSTAAGTEKLDLNLEYYQNNSAPQKTKARIENNQITFETPPALPFPFSILIASTERISPEENAQRFSQLEAAGKEKDIVEILKFLEPNIKRLVVSSVSATPEIRADIGNKILMPTSYMGDGINRLISICLAIASAPNGVVLIDEIENGLHYSTLVDIWKAIGLLSKKTNTQIFATTHSWECIKSAHIAFSTMDSYPFCLHRLDRLNNKINVITYDKQTLQTSVDMNLEVR